MNSRWQNVRLYLVFVAVVLFIGVLGSRYWLETSRSLHHSTQSQSLVATSTKSSESKAISPASDNLQDIFYIGEGNEARTKVYFSEKLGVGFAYLVNQSNATPTITESDNMIHFQNCSIELFTKDPKLTLEEGVRAQFLQGIDPKDCFTTVYEDGKSRPNYIKVGISYPPSVRKSKCSFLEKF